MRIIGCDFHTRYQQMAMMDTETGELVERRLEQGNGEARAFYASLPKPALVGMEATGYGRQALSGFEVAGAGGASLYQFVGRLDAPTEQPTDTTTQTGGGIVRQVGVC